MLTDVAIITLNHEKVNLHTFFYTLFIAIYRHLCYNQDIEQIGGEMQWITQTKD